MVKTSIIHSCKFMFTLHQSTLLMALLTILRCTSCMCVETQLLRSSGAPSSVSFSIKLSMAPRIIHSLSNGLTLSNSAPVSLQLRSNTSSSVISLKPWTTQASTAMRDPWLPHHALRVLPGTFWPRFSQSLRDSSPNFNQLSARRLIQSMVTQE